MTSPMRQTRPNVFIRIFLFVASATLLLATLGVAIGALLFFALGYPNPSDDRSKVTTQQNTVLWSLADAALVKFVSLGLPSMGGGASQQVVIEMDPYQEATYDFSLALDDLRNVKPPDEQARAHKALLLLYEEMLSPMLAILEALQQGDDETAEVEWERLRLLVAEAAATVQIFPQSVNASASPIATPRVLYRDDFTNPESGFPKSSSIPGTGRMGYGDGYYELALTTVTGRQDQPQYLLARTGNKDFADFAVEVDALLVEKKLNGAYGVQFHMVDLENYYWFGVDPNQQVYSLARRQKDQWITLVGWTTSESINPGTAKNRLKVIAKDAAISLFVNDAHLGTVRDSAFARGNVALRTDAWSSPITARFSRLIVTASD